MSKQKLLIGLWLALTLILGLAAPANAATCDVDIVPKVGGGYSVKIDTDTCDPAYVAKLLLALSGNAAPATATPGATVDPNAAATATPVPAGTSVPDGNSGGDFVAPPENFVGTDRHVDSGKPVVFWMLPGYLYNINAACECPRGVEDIYNVIYKGTAPVQVTLPEGSVWEYGPEYAASDEAMAYFWAQVLRDTANDRFPDMLPEWLNVAGVELLLSAR